MAYQALTLDIDPGLQRTVLKFGYGLNFKYQGQLSHSIDRFFIVAKFHLLKLKDIPTILRGILVHYNDFEYLSPCNSTAYGHIWWRSWKWPSTVYM